MTENTLGRTADRLFAAGAVGLRIKNPTAEDPKGPVMVFSKGNAIAVASVEGKGILTPIITVAGRSKADALRSLVVGRPGLERTLFTALQTSHDFNQ